MEEFKPDGKPLNFGSLSGIMERFGRVPYEQFQQELNDWFTNNLREKGIDMADLEKRGYPGLSELISLIYHKAELLQTLTESKIKMKDDESK
jgi:hypothetical protein